MAYQLSGVDARTLGSGAFGLSLWEVVKPVVGFRIRIRASPPPYLGIENIIQPEADDVATTKNFLFYLLEGEYVTTVVWAIQNNYVCGVQFQTNLRSSQWFGQHRANVTIKSMSAGQYQAIHSLCGNGHGLFGAVMWPTHAIVSKTLSGSADTQQPAFIYKAHKLVALGTDGYSFGTDVNEVAAIVVTVSQTSAGGTVSALRVLSLEEYQRYRAMIDFIELGVGAHVIELVADEKFTKVECVSDAQALIAIRLTTPRRSTPWFGSPTAWNSTSVSLEAPPCAHISGLFGQQTGSDVEELSVMTAHSIDQSGGNPVAPVLVVKTEASAPGDGRQK